MKARSSNNCRDGTRVRDIHVRTYTHTSSLLAENGKTSFPVAIATSVSCATILRNFYVKFEEAVVVISTHQLFIDCNNQRIRDTGVS